MALTDVETWLIQRRDRYVDIGWTILNELLDDYRLHIQTGTPLTKHVCDCGDLPETCPVAPDSSDGIFPTEADEERHRELADLAWTTWENAWRAPWVAVVMALRPLIEAEERARIADAIEALDPGSGYYASYGQHMQQRAADIARGDTP